MSGANSSRIRLRFALKRAWSVTRRSWRCHVAFGDEPLGLRRKRPWIGSSDDSLPSDASNTSFQDSFCMGPEPGPSGSKSAIAFPPDVNRITEIREEVTFHPPAGLPPTWWSWAQRRTITWRSIESNLPVFPTGPDQITAEWLTGILKRSGVLSYGCHVTHTSSERMGEGVGLVSLLHRVRVQYGGVEPPTQAPATLVLKFGHPTPEVRRMALANGSYQREIGFYNLSGNRLIRGCSVANGLPTPVVYSAEYHDASGDMLLVMEDLAGTRHLDQLQGATLDQARTVIQNIASCHAKFWEDRELKSSSWLPKMSDKKFKDFDPGEYPSSWQKFLSMFPNIVPPSMEAELADLHSRCSSLLDHLGNGPITLLHGDLRLDNIYEVNGGNDCDSWQSGNRLRYMDFGDCCMGRGPADVAYFLSQSLDPEMRRSCEQNLVEEYWTALCSHGSGRVENYSMANCWLDYRVAVLYYWVLAVNVCAHVPPGDHLSSRVGLLAKCMVTRSIAAIIDLNCLDLLRNFEP